MPPITTKNANRELRCFVRKLELRAAPDAGGMPTLVGHAAVFNKRSEVMYGMQEIVLPGAFKASLDRGDDVRAMVEHEGGLQLIGRRSSGTLRLSEDATGLAVEVDMPNTQAGRDTVELVKRGDLSGMSFGFRTIEEAFERLEGDPQVMYLRKLVTVDVIDVSVVTFPAYPDTDVATRSLQAFQASLNSKDQDVTTRLNLLEASAKATLAGVYIPPAG